MYIILVYDIRVDEKGQKILNKVFKVCKRYLCHIQSSVFEGELSEGQIVEFDLIETAKGLQAINVLTVTNVRA